MKIDCTQCRMYDSEHCADCLVTALLHPPRDVVELDDDLEESLGLLSDAGLLPMLRWQPRGREPASSEIFDQTSPEGSRTLSA